MPRLLFSLGLSFILMAVLWHFGSRLGLGQLPGDIIFKRGQTSFYVPLGTCLLLSVLLSLVLWVIRKLSS